MEVQVQDRQWQVLWRKRKKEASDRPGTMGDGDTHAWGRARYDMRPSMTGQGGMAQREEREKTFRKPAGKQNGEIQGSQMEEVCPKNSSKECRAPACSITLRSWST